MSEEKAFRGFAAMKRTTQRAIASLGGKTAHARGTARQWTSETARAAGLKSAAARKAREEAR